MDEETGYFLEVGYFRTGGEILKGVDYGSAGRELRNLRLSLQMDVNDFVRSMNGRMNRGDPLFDREYVASIEMGIMAPHAVHVFVMSRYYAFHAEIDAAQFCARFGYVSDGRIMGGVRRVRKRRSYREQVIAEMELIERRDRETAVRSIEELCAGFSQVEIEEIMATEARNDASSLRNVSRVRRMRFGPASDEEYVGSDGNGDGEGRGVGMGVGGRGEREGKETGQG